LHQKYSEIKLALLVEDNESVEQHITQLGFIPQIYSPEYILVNEALMLFCKEKNMKVIPWTVNDKENILKLISLGVDGIITDYPNFFYSLEVR